MEKSESLFDDGSDESSFLSFRHFFFLSRLFSLMKILQMMVMGPGHLVRALFHFPLKNLLVVTVEYFPLVVSVEYFPLFMSVEYLKLVESEN